MLCLLFGVLLGLCLSALTHKKNTKVWDDLELKTFLERDKAHTIISQGVKDGLSPKQILNIVKANCPLIGEEMDIPK